MEQEIEGERQRLLGKYYIGMLANDFDGMDKTLELINEFNGKYPEAAISGENILDSMSSREKQRIEREMFGGVKPQYELRASKKAKKPGE